MPRYIGESGLRKHLSETVRIGDYHGFLRYHDSVRIFYLEAIIPLKERYNIICQIKTGDEISFKTAHPRTPVMTYKVKLGSC